MTLPNVITLLRIILIPLLAVFLLSPNPQFVNISAVLFVILALSDALDGWLARTFVQVSELGKFLDPLADKILVIVALIGLVEIGRVSSIPVMIIIGREFVIMGLRVFTAGRGDVLEASFSAKGKTLLQMLAAFMLILNWPYATWALWLAVIVSVISGVEYFFSARSRGLLW